MSRDGEDQVVKQTPSNEWPAWLINAGSGASDALHTFIAVAQRCRSAHAEGYRYRYILNDQVNNFVDTATTGMEVGPKLNGQLSDFQCALIIANNGRVCVMYSTLIAAKQVAVAQLVEAIRATAWTDSLLATFSLLRALIEHVAQFDAFITRMPSCEATTKFDETNKALGMMYGHCARSLYATRFDWSILQKTRTDKLFEAKNTAYKPNENRADLTARSVMSAIDGLGKSFSNIRPIYDWLCEFAHPNYGVLAALVDSAQPATDARGIVWVEKRLVHGVPTGFVKYFGPAINEILVQCARCLERFEELLRQSEAVHVHLLSTTQTVIQRLMSRHPKVFEPYELCPCGSGAKVKYCCGKRRVATI